MLHLQVQKYIIAQKNGGYSMRSKDIIGIHGASLIIYGLAIPGGASVTGTLEDISDKLSIFMPMIGNTKNSLGMDFIRLTIASWQGSPSATPGDGYVDFSTNTPLKMQYLKTSFIPPANQTTYHLSYYTNTSVAPPGFPIQVDVGSANGIGLSLGMTSNSGVLGNLYNTTNAFCTMTNPGNGNPIKIPNAFIISRFHITNDEHFYYAIDDASIFDPNESSNSPVTNSTTAFAPGFVSIGADLAAPGVTYSTKNCEGVSVGPGLPANQAFLLLSAYYYIHINK